MVTIKHRKVVKILEKFFRNNLKKISYSFCLGGNEKWLQFELALAFYKECYPIAWLEKRDSFETIKGQLDGKSVKVAEILLEMPNRCDLVISKSCFIRPYAERNNGNVTFSERTIGEIKRKFNDKKKTHFHYIEIKQNDIDYKKFKKAGSARLKLLRLKTDIEKLIRCSRRTKSRAASINAIGIYRFYNVRKNGWGRLNVLERDLKRIIEKIIEKKDFKIYPVVKFHDGDLYCMLICTKEIELL